MKLKGLPMYVAVVGGAIAIYAFVKSGGYLTAQRDLARATGGAIPAPAAPGPLTNPATGQPTFGARNPWSNDPIFAPYQAGSIGMSWGAGSLTGGRPPASLDSFGARFN